MSFALRPAWSYEDLDRFFHPRSVALVGASDKPGKVGTAILENLLFGAAGERDRSRGFPGKVYPVNAKGATLFGHKAFASCAELPEPVDFAVIAVPPPQVPEVVTEVAARGARAISIISGGFGELGKPGEALQEEVVRRARAAGARVLGPNTLGVLSVNAGLNASFARTTPRCGGISFLSQSGALITGLIEYALEENIGFSKIVSIGDKCDLDDVDLLRYLARDPETQVIAVYIEALRDGRSFFEAAREVVRRKPIVAYKSGRSESGARAAASHTGSLAGNDAAYAAAFRQAGVFRADTIYSMVDAAMAWASQPVPVGNRIAVLTNAGGPGVICADEAASLGLGLARLSDSTLVALDKCLPAIWSRGNPIDIIGDAGPDRYEASLQALLAAPEVDGIVLVCTPQAMTEPLETAKRIVQVVEASPARKPLTASFLGIVHQPSEDWLDAHGIPERAFPERSVRAMDALVKRGEQLRRLAARDERPVTSPAAFDPELGRYLHGLAAAGRTTLTLAEARRVFALAGLPMNASVVATSPEEAARAARSVGFPVAMKVVSEQVLHKSESGGVKVGLGTEAEVSAAYDEIRASVRRAVPGAVIDGVAVDEVVRGTELILGASTDPLFGKLVMFGMGGIFVEVYKDVSFRLAPLTLDEAHDMLDELRARPILDGARGAPKADKDLLAALLVRVGDLVRAFPQIRELDVNPLVVSRTGTMAIDARVLLEDAAPRS
ncbi:MAG: acetate--CoA ligase family protein [Planctomycetes bacterium]|nr:acetate--CoA ligase family protein [Planctomycetota bacterium]